MRFRLPLGVVLVIACAVLATGLRFTNDPTEHFPRSTRAVAEWLELSKRFDAFNTMIVGLEEPGEPFTADGLKRLQKITTRLAGLKANGVLAAQSITNVESIHEGADGSLETELLIAKIPDDPRELSKKVAADAQVSGALISRDQRGYLIIIRADPRRDAAALASDIFQIVEEERGPMKAAWFGATLLTAALGRDVGAKLPWVVPLCVVILLAAAALLIRSPSKIAVQLGSTALALVVWAGLARVSGASLGVSALAALPVVALLAAVAFGRAPPFGQQAVARLAVIGLAGFALSRDALAFVGAFGLVVALGAVAIALTGLLILSPLSKGDHPAPAAPTSGLGFAVLLLLAGTAVVGLMRAKFQPTPSRIFSRTESAGQSLEFFEAHFGGANFVQLDFRGDLKDPAVAARLMRLTDLLEGSPVFGDVRSVAQVLGFLNHGFGGVSRIPPSRETLANLWFFLEGRSDVRSLVSDARDEAVIALRVPADQSEEVIAAELTVAIADSRQQGPEGAQRRLASLARAFKVQLDPTRLQTVFNEPVPDLSEVVHARLSAWLSSPDSPYQPTAEEWAQLKAGLGGTREQLVELCKKFPSVGEHAEQLVESVLSRERDLLTAARAQHQASTLIGPAEVPDAFRQRVAGVFAELTEPQTDTGAASQVLVSGLPMIEPQLERDLLRGVSRSLVLLLVICALVTFLLTRSAAFATRTVLEALIATGLTISAVTSFAGGIDPGSAPLMLMPALAVLVLFDLAEPRKTAGLFLALGIAAAPLIVMGSAPLARIGLALLIGAFDVVVVRSISQAFIKRTAN